MNQGLGLVIGATLMDLKRATTLASVTVMTFMLAGGFFVKVTTQIYPFVWPSYKILGTLVVLQVVSLVELTPSQLFIARTIKQNFGWHDQH